MFRDLLSLSLSVLDSEVLLDAALGVLLVLSSLLLCVVWPVAAVALYGGGASRAIGGAWG